MLVIITWEKHAATGGGLIAGFLCSEVYRFDQILEFLILRYFSIFSPLVRDVVRRRSNFFPDRLRNVLENGEGNPYRHRDAGLSLPVVSPFRIPGVRVEFASNAQQMK